MRLWDCNAITECEFTGKPPWRLCNNTSMSSSNAEPAQDDVNIMMLLVVKKECKEEESDPKAVKAESKRKSRNRESHLRTQDRKGKTPSVCNTSANHASLLESE